MVRMNISAIWWQPLSPLRRILDGLQRGRPRRREARWFSPSRRRVLLERIVLRPYCWTSQHDVMHANALLSHPAHKRSEKGGIMTIGTGVCVRDFSGAG